MPVERENTTDADDERNGFKYLKTKKTVPPDQINKLSYGLHPDGHVNSYETPSMLTEYQLKFCTFKLETAKQLEISRLEQQRVIRLMDQLLTVQQRSYTDPHLSHYPVIRSRAVKPLLDRSREAQMKIFKMAGWSEYQTIYDRLQDYKKTV